MKISVPWPSKERNVKRIKEALSLWPNKNSLLICLAEENNDPFLSEYDTIIMSRNSKDIGTKIPKCYISDMVESAAKYDCEWCGFGNSDLVPTEDLITPFNDYEILIFHRTEIDNWDHRFGLLQQTTIEDSLLRRICDLRAKGDGNKKIALMLNCEGIKAPEGHSEWTYIIIQELCNELGEVFFWGQDMFLFKKHVVQKVLKDYLKVKDPILGTGGFDPRLSKYLMENYKGMRVLNKIFHKRHTSEWTSDEIEYKHNGGDIPMYQLYEYYGHDYMSSMYESGYRAPLPRYLKYLLGKKRPDIFDKMVNY